MSDKCEQFDSLDELGQVELLFDGQLGLLLQSSIFRSLAVVAATGEQTSSCDGSVLFKMPVKTLP